MCGSVYSTEMCVVLVYSRVYSMEMCVCVVVCIVQRCVWY